jgi:DNA polymerase-3 subunit beta
MKFRVSRDALLKPLNLVAGCRRAPPDAPGAVQCAVESRRQPPVHHRHGSRGRARGAGDSRQAGEAGRSPCRRASLRISARASRGRRPGNLVADGKATVRSGRSRFTLATLPAREFPNIEDSIGTHQFVLKQGELRRLIDRTALPWHSRTCATTSMACTGNCAQAVCGPWLRTAIVWRVYVPGHAQGSGRHAGHHAAQGRAGVARLMQTTTMTSRSFSAAITSRHHGDFTFTSKAGGRQVSRLRARIAARPADKIVQGSRVWSLRQAFTRTAILSNEKYRGVRLKLSEDNLDIVANNPEQEQAEEQVPVSYSGDPLEIGFNVGYLLDVLGVLSGEKSVLPVGPQQQCVAGRGRWRRLACMS